MCRLLVFTIRPSVHHSHNIILYHQVHMLTSLCCTVKLNNNNNNNNHFHEMKGDVGMSSHEERGQENAYTKTELFITPFCSRADFPSFFPFYLSSSPSDLHTPPFFQFTRGEIGSEIADDLSEDNPVKNLPMYL